MQKNLSQKTILISVLVLAFLGLVWLGVAKYRENQAKKAEIVRVEEEKRAEAEEKKKAEVENEQNQKNSEIASVMDLVDGEYIFENVDTSNWQTYKNEEMGFELKIPKNWEAIDTSYSTEGKPTKKISIREKATYCDNSYGWDCEISISYSERYFNGNSYYENLDSWKKNYNTRVEILSMDNLQAIKVDVFGGRLIYFFEGTKAWTISINMQGHRNILKNYPGIIKTFKFLRD